MIIKSPDPLKRMVEDYDFTLAYGQSLSLTVDRTAGDTVSYDHEPLAVVITLVSKPSMTNPDAMLPREEITIYQAHILAVQRRDREVTDLTVEQKEQWNEAMSRLGIAPKSVN